MKPFFVLLTLALSLTACSGSSSTPLPIGGPIPTPVPQITSVQTNAGMLELNIVAITPPSGTTLTQCPPSNFSSSCQVFVTIQFKNKSSEGFRIWAAAGTDDTNYFYQPSDLISEKTGTLERSFGFNSDGQTATNLVSSIIIFAVSDGSVGTRQTLFRGRITGLQYSFVAP